MYYYLQQTFESKKLAEQNSVNMIELNSNRKNGKQSYKQSKKVEYTA